MSVLHMHYELLYNKLSVCLATYFQDLYAYYHTQLTVAYSKLPHLRRNYTESIFPAIAFNFGGKVWCFSHRDTNNLSFGMCAITALGNFNPIEGGHLILDDIKVAIQFPPASTILIPSASLTHANVPIQKDENRLSFTQYAAGPIFQWVENGCRTDEQLNAEELHKQKERRANAWKEGLKLLPNINK